MKTSIPLLILSDDAEDIDNIYLHVKPNFGHKGTATDAATGSEYIMGLEACVIALCFRSLDDAQELYTDLLRRAIHNRPIRHRTILLCSTHQVRDACLASMRGKFDDFTVFKPLADPCVLRFRVYRQARALETEARYKQAVSEQQVRQSRRITERAFATMSEEHGRMKAEADRSHDQLRRQIGRQVGRLEHSIRRGEMADSIQVLDEDKLSTRFDLLVNQDLAHELEEFRSSLRRDIDVLLERYNQIRQRTQGALDSLVPSEKPPLSTLVVDDDPELNDLLREMLEEENHQVLQAFDGDSGYFAAVHHAPDLALIDINLPKLNGLKLCQKLRANPKTRELPIVIVTGNATRQVVESGRRVGVRQFLVKPFSYDTLQEKVGAALEEVTPEGPRA